jgi:uroporphyrinogen-III synthase
MSSTGYPLSQYTIRPFGDHDLTDDPEEAESRKRFNVLLSSSRQAVEHAFGRLKGRFPILRCLPGYKMGTIYKTVESVLVLHNILEQFGDSPDAIPGFNGDEDEVVREALARLRALDETGDNLNKNTLYLSGVLRRKVLLAEMKRTGMI